MIEHNRLGSSTMKRILILGDAHIPTRRDSIPDEFYRHIESTDYDLAFITGDLVRIPDFKKALPELPTTYYVRGNMDFHSEDPFHHMIHVEQFGFLLLHGTQLRPRGNIEQLWEILQEVNLDVAVHGHTHRADIQLYRGCLFLNPGTISGATGGWPGRDDASFIEIEVNNLTMRVILFITDWSVVKQSDLSFQKQSGYITQIG